MGGVPACIDPMWSKASAVIATTLIDLLSDRSLVERRRRSFATARGGVAGSKWVAPLPPADFKAPIGYRWPGICRDSRAGPRDRQLSPKPCAGRLTNQAP
jgi:aminobenzoyl-glutamate utilization protein B